MRLVRKVYNPEGRGDCAWIAIQCSPEKSNPFFNKLGGANSTTRSEKVTWLRELALDYLSGKPVRHGSMELAGEQLSVEQLRDILEMACCCLSRDVEKRPSLPDLENLADMPGSEVSELLAQVLADHRKPQHFGEGQDLLLWAACMILKRNCYALWSSKLKTSSAELGYVVCDQKVCAVLPALLSSKRELCVVLPLCAQVRSDSAAALNPWCQGAKPLPRPDIFTQKAVDDVNLVEIARILVSDPHAAWIEHHGNQQVGGQGRQGGGRAGWWEGYHTILYHTIYTILYHTY